MATQAQPAAGAYNASSPPVAPRSSQARAGGWIIALRVLSIIFAGVTLGMAVDTAVSADDTLASLAAPTALAIVWDLVDLIIICVTRTHHGIHPAAAIGVDFAIWAACAGMAGWVGTVLSPIQALCNDPGCNDPWDWVLVNLYVIIAFLCALLLVHVTLFIIACVKLSRRQHDPAPQAPVLPQAGAVQGGAVPEYITINGQLMQVVPVEKSLSTQSPPPMQQQPPELEQYLSRLNEAQGTANIHEMYHPAYTHELQQ